MTKVLKMLHIFIRPNDFPKALTIEPTNRCNLNCYLCPSGAGSLKRKKTDMPIEKYKALIDEASGKAQHLTLFLFGEPLLHKHILEMARYASALGMHINLSTNANTPINHELAGKIAQSGINNLTISLDGADQETYNKYRSGGDFNKVLKATNILTEAKNNYPQSKMKITLQSVITKYNESQRNKLIKLAKTMGADAYYEKPLAINLASEKETTLAKNYHTKNREKTRYKLKNNTLQINGEIINHCPSLLEQKMMVITADGNVIPCCNDYNSEHIMGNALEQGIANIWNNKPFKQFRKKIKRDQKSIGICQRCPFSRKVEFKAPYFDFNK